MRVLFPLAFASIILSACDNNVAESKPAENKTATATVPPAEFADARFVESGKSFLKKFEEGDIDAWMEQFAENAVFSFSSGDSLAGKKAIAEYWKDRRKNVIQSIKFSNDIWLPVKINQSQKGPDRQGNWLLCWYQVEGVYNGKTLNFWVHTDLHFDENDKVDRAIQYVDRAPIQAAMKQ